MSESAYVQELKEIQEQVDLMRKLGTRDGFFKHYFKELGVTVDGIPKHRTNFECFNAINEIYYDLYGEYRYSDYASFYRSYSYFIKSK